jgi:PTS system mannose-specific IIA component
MGVALLLITHDDIGSSLLDTAINMMGVSPMNNRNLVITQQMDIEQGVSQARQLCSELSNGDGILIVTDMYGSTPGNIASRLLESHHEEQIIIVTGVNLPMLVRIMNYASLSLPELAQKACSSANDSIFIIDKPSECH